MVEFLLGAGSLAVGYGLFRVVRFVINDTNAYYEQARIDAIEAKLISEGRCTECGGVNDRKVPPREWDDFPHYCSSCLSGGDLRRVSFN